ncbi:MAG: hydrolase [Desulfobulbus propionicus]|nr:MAG: hydrolase [Desulfobulbus propionicus]
MASPVQQLESFTFSPPFWLTNPHLQTLFPQLFRRRPRLDLQSERVELPDGDYIDLAWAADRGGPRVLILHGLEGSLTSHYIGPAITCLEAAGYTPVFMHLRGCGPEVNRLPRSYHSGATEDLLWVLERLAGDGRPIGGAVGFSLGGNILLKYLGEAKNDSLLDCAAAISVPFRLDSAGKRLERGLSQIYQRYLLDKLKRSYHRKKHLLPPDLQVKTTTIKTLRQYDELITAPLNGFSSADDYYTRCSSSGFIGHITRPTLILQALDDPFMYAEDIPETNALGPGVELLTTKHGGHVAFIEKGLPWHSPTSLIDRLVPAFFQRHLKPPPPPPATAN